MCLAPRRVTITTRFSRYTTDVPCGKCVLCLRNAQNAWIPRIYSELQEQKIGSFVTLTYRDSAVPRVVDRDSGLVLKTLRKSDFQEVLKRFRQAYCRKHHITKVSWKYFMCGEYGPQTKRPHYHVIFFGLSKKDLLPFLSDWQNSYGFTNIKSIEISPKSLFNVSKYVAKYAVKGIFENPFAKKYKIATDNPLCPFIDSTPLCLPAYRTLSKGLGKSYITNQTYLYHLASDFICNDSDAQCDEIIRRKFHTYTYSDSMGKTQVFKIPLCRYYQKHIFGQANFLTDSNFRALCRRAQSLYQEEFSSLPAEMDAFEKDDLIRNRHLAREQIRADELFDQLTKYYVKSKI